MLSTNLSIRVTQLVAQTGPAGATASVVTATSGTDAPKPGAETLLKAYRAEVGTDADQNAALKDRTKAAEKAMAEARKSSDAEVLRQVDRMNRYLKALKKLGVDPTLRPNILTISHGKDGLGVQATRGDDRLAISADTVAQVDTGGGNDALTLQADRVGTVTTDRADSRGDRDIDREAQGNDAIAIAARIVQSVDMGGGNDVLAAQAQMIAADLGAGDDVASIWADITLGLAGGAGKDVIALQTRLGGTAARTLTETADGTPVSATQAAATLYADTATRLAAVAANVADVDGGSGDDVISVAGAQMIGVAGGAGNDLIAVEGRTVALHYGKGDGADVVQIGAGTDVLVQLAARPDGGSDPGDYTVTLDGDRMTLRFASGSIEFTGVHQAGTIAVARGFAAPKILSAPPATLRLVL
ncbi:MAG: hypothetical protein KBF78_17540 [Fuscovulum sp.]|nr:hypothetical protein [Fuscovulum sp.]